MALNIIRDPDLTSQFSTALGTGLQQLAAHKLEQLSQQRERERYSKAIQQIPGVPEKVGNLLANVSPEERKLLFQNLGGLMGLFQQQEPTAQAGITPSGLDESIQQQVQQQISPQVEQAKRIQDVFTSPGEKRQQELLELKKQSATEKAFTKKQQAIDKANEPFLTQLNKGIPVAEEMYDKANEMLKLLETGKVANTLVGSIAETPGIGRIAKPFLNEESQRFLALSNDIAALLAANSGVATNFKIKFAQERKPNLTQKVATQKALTEDIIKQAKKVLERERIANELVGKNNYQQPPNLKSQVDKIYRENLAKEQKKQSKKTQGLPPVNAYSEDAIIEIDGNQFKKNEDNTGWVRL